MTRRRRPLGPYVALIGTYVTMVVGGLAGIRRVRGGFPDRLPAGDIALLGVATFKLSRLVAKEKVTLPLREPFADVKGPGSGAEVEMQPHGTGLRRAVGELVTCPFCISQWIGTALVFARILAPRPTRLVASILAVVAVSDATQYLNAGVHRLESHDQQ